jgi:hypothetical protein
MAGMPVVLVAMTTVTHRYLFTKNKMAQFSFIVIVAGDVLRQKLFSP